MQEVFEKIIEKLEEELKLADKEKERCIKENHLQFDSAKGYANGVAIAIEIVKQEAEKFGTDTNVGSNGWISCSERLPENNNIVLCWVVSKTIASGETFIIGSCDRGFWFLQTYEIGHHYFPVKDYEVVAWMPLPEPYQPKGE